MPEMVLLLPLINDGGKRWLPKLVPLARPLICASSKQIYFLDFYLVNQIRVALSSLFSNKHSQNPLETSSTEMKEMRNSKLKNQEE